MKKHVTVYLRNGKEITFDTSDKSWLFECTGANTLIAESGVEYHINSEDISAIKAIPYVKCPHCEQDVTPEICTEICTTKAGDKVIGKTTVCPLCGADLND